MNYNAMMFSNEGPLMEGTWYNPNNGDSFTVSDCFFQDNQYLVKTTDGRLLDYNFIQNYIKSDKPLNFKKNTTQALPKEVSSILDDSSKNFDDGILEDDIELIRPKSLGNLNDPQRTPEPIQTPKQPSYESIIDRALSKKSQPLLDIAVNWDNFPLKEMDLLIDIMELSVDDIINWYVSQIDMIQVRKIISDKLIECISNNLSNNPDNKPEKNPQETLNSEIQNISEEKPSKSKSTKKNKKK